MVFPPLLNLSYVAIINATSNIPRDYYQKLDLEETYVYEIAAYNTSKRLEWADLNWMAPTKGFVNMTPAGQLKVNFTGFYEKDPSDTFNIFESPLPYMDIEFVENRSDILVTNATLSNVSNGEAAQNLLLGYNRFKSGFLIPINDFNNLTQQAYAQDEPPYWNATVSVKKTSKSISFDFKQEIFFQQETFCIYDKATGLLIYTNTSIGNYFLEMSLINMPKDASEPFSIPSFQLLISLSIIGVATMSFISLTRKKLKQNEIKFT